MNSAAPPRLGRWALLSALLPILLLAVYVARGFAASNAEDLGTARATAAETAPLPAEVCTFPGAGAERARLAFVIIDSLRYDTATNPALMPFVSSLQAQSLHGRMKPCLSQLSLLCMRTMLEGREPLLVTGLTNFTGMQVQAPSLIAQLGARGVRTAMVADAPLVSLYRSSLTESRTFEDRQEKVERDIYARSSALTWMDDRSLDAVLTLIIDTDGIAHREGIATAAYAEKFREADDTVREISARLGPRDTLFLLGDHGHDAEGHHSTGIEAPTAYFARGPMFPPGQRLDTDMATTRFFLSMATCTPVSAGYDGQAPVDALRVPDTYRDATRELMAKLPHKANDGEEGALGVLLRWLPIGILMVALLGLVRRAEDDPEALATPVMLNLALLGAGFVIPPALALWIAAAANVALALLWNRRRRALTAGPAPLEQLARVGLALQVVAGMSAHRVLVPLQDHVNTLWQACFAAGLIAATLLCAAPLRRVLHTRFGLAAGWAAWGLMFFGLFLGPYYYGSARNVLFGVTWLVLALAGRRLVRDRAVLRHAALTVLPIIPLHLPLMKEWKLRYMFLDDAIPLPVVLGVLAAATALAIALSPDRAPWRRALPLFAAFLGLALATQLPHGTVLAASLLFLSYQGFCGVSRALSGAEGAEGTDDVIPMERWLAPVGQVSYAFMLFFVLMRGIRFANVSFEFTLALIPVGRGETVAALIAMPLVLVKYCAPVVLLLASGDRPGAPALHLLLCKLAAVTAFLAGMELAGVPSTGLFSRLLTQEIALLVFLYAAAVLAAAIAVGRLPRRAAG